MRHDSRLQCHHGLSDVQSVLDLGGQREQRGRRARREPATQSRRTDTLRREAQHDGRAVRGTREVENASCGFRSQGLVEPRELQRTPRDAL